MLCFICNQHETATNTNVLCGECLRYELAQAMKEGHVGMGFILGPANKRVDYDTFNALVTAGLMSLDFPAQYGLTEEQVLHVAHSSVDLEKRMAARQLLVAQEVLVGMLQIAYPIQTALGTIWYPQQAGFDPSQDELWRAALDFAVSAVLWKLQDEAARQELKRRAISEGRELQSVKRDELRTALLLALALYTPEERRIRLDGTWHTVTPTELKWKYAWRWLFNETCKLADESLRGYGRTTGEQQTSRSGEALALLNAEEDLSTLASEGDPLFAVLLHEEFAQVLNALQNAPRREREVVRLLLEGMSRKEVAEAMGITAGALREHLRHFRERLSA